MKKDEDEDDDEDKDEEEEEEEDEDKDEEEDPLHTSWEPFRMITKLILARFTVFKKSGYGRTNGPTNGPTDGQSLLKKMRGRI